MQREDGLVIPSGVGGATQSTKSARPRFQFRGWLKTESSRNPSTPLRTTARSFGRGERLVKMRLVAIGCVAMNNPTLGRLVDCRNRHANLIGRGLWR